MPELFDSHCHIDFHHFDEDRNEIFLRMKQVGVVGLIAVAVELVQVPRLVALAEDREDVWFSVGMHPNHVTDVEPDINALIQAASHPKCVAIGETGMDFFRHHVDPALQAERFRVHIRAAREVKKPVIVHMRDADEATLDVLKEEGVSHCGGVMHCFSSGWETARRALRMGLSISFSGNVTFPKNEALREVAAQVPDEYLLIETDSPYLAPMPRRGKRNEPAFVYHVAECLAEVRGVSLEMLARLTTNNAMRRFGLKHDAMRHCQGQP